MATKLPRKLEQKMQTVGEQIRLARLRRNLSIAQVARTCHLFTSYNFTHRERCTDSGNWYLS